VRELENVIERTVALTDGDVIERDDLPLEVEPEGTEGATGVTGTGLTQRLEALESRLIREALAESGGVKARAAQILGIKTSALYYKLDKYGLD